MFTGLIEDTGVLYTALKKSDVLFLEIGDTKLARFLGKGDSVCVSGACLSVVEIPSENRFTAELMPETANRTTLGKLAPGARVNLERSLPVSGRFEGHLVTGHVDTKGVISEKRQLDKTALLKVKIAPEYLRYIVEKGSIAVDGVSLTVIDTGPDWFSVGIIPVTLSTTTLAEKKRRDEVNIECDILAKYLEKLVLPLFGPGKTKEKSGLTKDALREMGWEI